MHSLQVNISLFRDTYIEISITLPQTVSSEKAKGKISFYNREIIGIKTISNMSFKSVQTMMVPRTWSFLSDLKEIFVGNIMFEF